VNVLPRDNRRGFSLAPLFLPEESGNPSPLIIIEIIIRQKKKERNRKKTHGLKIKKKNPVEDQQRLFRKLIQQ